MSSGIEGRGSEMNNYSERKLRSLGESRLAGLAVMSSKDVKDIRNPESRYPTHLWKSLKEVVHIVLTENCVNG